MTRAGVGWLLSVMCLAACSMPAPREDADPATEQPVASQEAETTPPEPEPNPIRDAVLAARADIEECDWVSESEPSYACDAVDVWLDLPYDAAHASVYMEMIDSASARDRLLGALKLDTPLGEESVLTREQIEHLFTRLEAELDPGAAETLGLAVSSQPLVRYELVGRVVAFVRAHPVERARGGLLMNLLERAPSQEIFDFVMKTIDEAKTVEMLEAGLTALNNFSSADVAQSVAVCDTWLEVTRRTEEPTTNLGIFYLSLGGLHIECDDHQAPLLDLLDERAMGGMYTDTYGLIALETMLTFDESPQLRTRIVRVLRAIATNPANGYNRVESLGLLEKFDPNVTDFVEACVGDPEEYVAKECQRIRDAKK